MTTEPYPNHATDAAAYDRNRQIEQHELAGMSPTAIDEARQAGRLDLLLGADPADVELRERAVAGRITQAEAARLNALHHYDLTVKAFNEGRLITDTEENN